MPHSLYAPVIIDGGISEGLRKAQIGHILMENGVPTKLVRKDVPVNELKTGCRVIHGGVWYHVFVYSGVRILTTTQGNTPFGNQAEAADPTVQLPDIVTVAMWEIPPPTP